MPEPGGAAHARDQAQRPATGTAGKPIKVAGSFPDDSNLLVITPNGKTMYTVSNTVVTPIDTATGTAGRAIQVAPRHSGAVAAVITPDGRTIYVAGQFDGLADKGFIVPVSTATGTAGRAIVIRGLPLPMAVTPDGKTLYILRDGGASLGAPQDVLPVNTATGTAGMPINTGVIPAAIAITGSHQQR